MNINSESNQKLGKKIIQLRLEKNMTSEQLSFMSGVSKTGLRYIERGISDPKISTLYRIAIALKIPLSRLLNY